MKKKAQLQIMQNMFILLFIFIILILTFTLFVWRQNLNQSDKLYELTNLRSEQILNHALHLPELICIRSATIIDHCFEEHKIQSFDESQTLRYASLFGTSIVRVEHFNTSLQKWTSRTIYNNSLENPKYHIRKSIDIVILDQVSQSKNNGKLHVEVFA